MEATPVAQEHSDDLWHDQCPRCGSCGKHRHAGDCEAPQVYKCQDCGWAWPLPEPPPDHAECDNCGGELEAES